MAEKIKLYPVGCASPKSEEFDSVCARCIHRGDVVACQAYCIENGLTIRTGIR